MTTRIPTSMLVEYLLRCTKCGKDHKATMVANLNLGDVIVPPTTGSKYGRCVLCHNPGLRVMRRSDDGSGVDYNA